MKLLTKENYEWNGFNFTAYAKVWHFESTETADGKYNVNYKVDIFNNQTSATTNDGTNISQTDYKLEGVAKTNLNADYLTEQALNEEEFSEWTLTTT
jgi:hypothetical protein